MEYIRVTMIRKDLEEIPSFDFPEGFRCRSFKPGDEEIWADIEFQVAVFESRDKALERFREEFEPFLEEFENRCHFVENAEGECVGTATAWYDPSFQGQNYGRLHWVGIIPEYQGKNLARPLVCRAMNRLAASHDRAYLVTQTTRLNAIRIYLDFGFQPLILTENCPRAWQLVARLVKDPRLEPYRSQ